MTSVSVLLCGCQNTVCHRSAFASGFELSVQWFWASVYVNLIQRVEGSVPQLYHLHDAHVIKYLLIFNIS